ncbi:sigma-54-dependent transcriptional regulator [Aromatoleum diolicum]|uniref:Response regulator n=1 Tax=Aromatoleum diolicum TaxID=75796 RepID=A0ABX1QIV7_9RHOO|nr:sigma-54 dependent transcriptional regulator [Aromatoleum diolicum]NMG77447.1 response regulator [Aromatoleum diolicum]
MPQYTILVVEDDEILGNNICTSLQRHGWGAQLASSSEDALQMLGKMHPDIVLTDLNLPGITGIELIGRVRDADPDAKVILMTGDGNVQTAVDAMKAGAYDYLSKPLVLAELKLLIERALDARRMEKTLSFYQNREARDAGLAALLGNSPPIQAMKTMIRQLLDAEAHMAANDLPVVLIGGETGTGKELVARALHVDGVRGDGPFVEVNCASIPSHLLEAELFGHEKGAFTDARERRAGLVEAAEGGTLFLDEIGEIDLALQAKLLKLLEERSIRRLGSVKEIKVNLRIVSATNRDLEKMVREGKFRSDLYYRLHIITVNVPPLRARGDDIALLARHFLTLHARRYGKAGLEFNADALKVLKGYGWPGNVRELRNMLEQTVLLAAGKVITPNQLAICPGLSGPCDRDFHTLDSYCMSVPSNGVSVPEVERDLVIKMLDKTDWNVTKSARLLGLTRDMLRYRIEKLGLERPEH